MTQDFDRLSTIQLEQECARLRECMSEYETKLARTRSEFQAANDELIRRLRPAPAPAVTDHALLRYLERVKGIDVDAARAEMLTPGIAASIKAGATSVIVGGVKFVVSANKIITTYKTEREKRLA